MADYVTSGTAIEGVVFTFPLKNDFPFLDSMVVSWTTQDGTAIAGSDYTPSSGTSAVILGSTLTISIGVIKDLIAEPAETFHLLLSITNTVGGVPATTTFDHVITIGANAAGSEYEQVLQLPTEQMLAWAVTKGAKASPNDKALALEYARSEILNVRELSSTNTNARDAEYYLIGAHAAVTGDPVGSLLVLGSPVYDAYKGLASLVGLQKVMQADPDKLNSAPGGFIAAYKGYIDGFSGKVNKHVQVYHRTDKIILQKALPPAAPQPIETFTYGSQLDLHSGQATTIDVFRAPNVPKDSLSRIVLDQNYKSSLSLGGGHDFVVGGSGVNKVSGGGGNDAIFGLGGNDKLKGEAGNDLIDGGSGKDTLDGGAKNDALYGSQGNDVLTGGSGRDLLKGGPGADDFDFNKVSETGKTASTRDRIIDFSTGSDDIDLATIDANSKVAGNQKFKFIGTQKFHKVAGELHYTKSNPTGTANDKTIVEGDINGDGKADFQIELTGLKTLTAGDFVL